MKNSEKQTFHLFVSSLFFALLSLPFHSQCENNIAVGRRALRVRARNSFLHSRLWGYYHSLLPSILFSPAPLSPPLPLFRLLLLETR